MLLSMNCALPAQANPTKKDVLFSEVIYSSVIGVGLLLRNQIAYITRASYVHIAFIEADKKEWYSL